MNIHQQFASYWKTDNPVLTQKIAELYEALQNGNICIDASTEIQPNELVSEINSSIKPFKLYNNKLYLNKYFYYESKIIECIEAFKKVSDDYIAERSNKFQALEIHTDLLDNLEAFGSEATDWQFVGAINGYINQFSILTGGPGTGKTTTIAKMLKLIFDLEDKKLNVKMVAPTGKAASRMKEALESNPIYQHHLAEKLKNPESTTIHRLLGSKSNSHKFKRDGSNRIEADIIIVDEASMIDIPLFSKLMQAINTETTRLILLGDQNQLSSIEVGSLLKDMCESVNSNTAAVNHFSDAFINLVNQKIPTYKITPDSNVMTNESCKLYGMITSLIYSRRFSVNSQIGTLSSAVLHQNMDTLENYIAQKHHQSADFIKIDDAYDMEDVQTIATYYEEYINEPDIKLALQALNKVRILCAMRNGKQGIYHYNNLIETILEKKKLINTYQEYYHNRPILITQNTPTLDLFNGDIGIIRKTPEGAMNAYFLINNEIKSVPAGLLNDVETVFAMTIHKSQDSEFDKVLMVLPKNEENILLSKELIYTGITRAKKELYIHTTPEAFLNGVNRQVKRVSGIVERLNQN